MNRPPKRMLFTLSHVALSFSFELSCLLLVPNIDYLLLCFSPSLARLSGLRCLLRLSLLLPIAALGAGHYFDPATARACHKDERMYEKCGRGKETKCARLVAAICCWAPIREYGKSSKYDFDFPSQLATAGAAESINRR